MRYPAARILGNAVWVRVKVVFLVPHARFRKCGIIPVSEMRCTAYFRNAVIGPNPPNRVISAACPGTLDNNPPTLTDAVIRVSGGHSMASGGGDRGKKIFIEKSAKLSFLCKLFSDLQICLREYEIQNILRVFSVLYNTVLLYCSGLCGHRLLSAMQVSLRIVGGTVGTD